MNTIRSAIAMLLILATSHVVTGQDVVTDPLADPTAEIGEGFVFPDPDTNEDEIDLSSSAGVVDVSTAWSIEKARPGDKIVLAVIFDVRETWHINADDSQVSAGSFQSMTTTKVLVEPKRAANAGIASVATFERPLFPKAHKIEVSYAPEPVMVFDGKVISYLPVKIQSDAAPGKYDFEVSVGFAACDDTNCLNPLMPPMSDYVRLPVTLEIVGEGEPVGAEGDAAIFGGYQELAGSVNPNAIDFDAFGIVSFKLDASGAVGLTLLWLVAALGGFLLNLTPCVLPVIPLKIMGLSNSAGNRGKCFVLGLTMSLGVVAFWLLLGTLIATVSGFTAANQLFQYSAFTIGIGVVIAVMAVGMCGLFAVQLPQFVYKFNPGHDSLHGSFGFGVMTAILSTPCTAPFMGAAAAWAATQNAAVTMTTFLCIGAGMALPYLVLSAFPGLVNKMPRTGPASELIKQVMGLLMLAAAAYFVGTGLSGALATEPDPPTDLYWWPVMLMVMAAGAWLAWRTIRITPSIVKRGTFIGIGVLLIAIGAYGGVKFTEKGPIDWTYYTEDRLQEALADGKVVVLDFTAAWCANCHYLEKTQLNQQQVADLLNRKDVTAMKVDITRKNPEEQSKMLEVNTLTIPLLVVYSPDGEIVFRSDSYVAQQVVDALGKAGVKIDDKTVQAAATP